MAREIDKLLIRIEGDGSQLLAEYGKAEQATGGFASKLRSGLGVAGTAFKVFAGAATIAGGAAAAVFVRTAAEVDEIAKKSAKLGVATRRLAGLELAAEKSGVAANALGTGLQRMTRRVAEAAGGTGVAVKALGDLGLEASTLARLAPEDQFATIADAFEGVESQSEKVRLAFQLFDTEGVGLINTMKGGAAALEATQLEADRLGIALTEIDTARIEDANDAITLMQKASVGIARQATAAFAPLVEQLALTFVESQGDVRGWRGVIESAVDFAQSGIGFVIEAWLRLDSTGDIVIGSILLGFESAIRGAALFAKGLGFVAEKFGVDFVSKGAQSIEGLADTTRGLGLEFIKEGAQTAAQMEFVVKRLDDRITAARAKVRKIAPATPGGEVGGGEAAKAAADTRAKEREALAKDLALLEKSLLDKRERIAADFAERLEKLNAFLAAKLVTEERFAELTGIAAQRATEQLTALEQAEAAKRIRIKEAEEKAKLEAARKRMATEVQITQNVAGILTSIGDGLVAATKGNNKGVLIAQKAFAVAAIAINTAIAASRALAELGPIAGPVAAAAIIAGGAASVAKVAATQIGTTAALGGATGAGAGGGSEGFGQQDVCGAVEAVDKCRGGGDGEGSDGRLGSGNTFQIVQIGDDNVDNLVDQIRGRVDKSDVVVFSGNSRQASEVR